MSQLYPTQPGTRTVTQWLQLALPVLIVGVTALWLVMEVAKASGDGGALKTYDHHAFGAVPVSEDGRIKPLDTVAFNALLQLSGKQSLIDEMMLEGEGEGAGRGAIVWLAEVLAGRPESRQRAVFRIDDPEVLGLIDKTLDDGKYYSLEDLIPGMQQIEEQARAAARKDTDKQTRFEKHLIGLYQNIGLMYELQSGLRPYVVPPVADAGLADGADAGEDADWAPLAEAAPDGMGVVASRAGGGRPGWATWVAVVEAYGQEDPEQFNKAVVEHLKIVDAGVDNELAKAAFEQGFNAYRPFAKGIVFYVVAGVIGLLGLLLGPVLSPGWGKAVWRSGVGVLVVTFLLHTAALLIRMWLQGRPPVTNLYSSAVFIGWAVVGFAIVMELLSRLGIAALASSIVGVATLFIAHNLAKDGDTMGVMQAVLDSNFWLGTHVITVTLGYAATFLAGFLAILYIALGMFTPVLDKKSARLLSGMVYGVICFALLFSFVGTVLGGIWADQSWGRFWGWDPKENGAIMIVLLNAIILHARWGHLLKDRGIMVLAVGGNIITAWSWFGTNLLGVGLHSYGFMDGAMQKLGLFAIMQLVIMGVALATPTGMWVSFLKRPRHAKDLETGGIRGYLSGLWSTFAVLSLGGVLMSVSTLFTSFIFLGLEDETAWLWTGVLSPLVMLFVCAAVFGCLSFRVHFDSPTRGKAMMSAV